MVSPFVAEVAAQDLDFAREALSRGCLAAAAAMMRRRTLDAARRGARGISLSR
jgi:hypothetical protein